MRIGSTDIAVGDTIDFGDVEYNVWVDTTITIENLGNDTLRLNSWAVWGDDFRGISNPAISVIV